MNKSQRKFIRAVKAAIEKPLKSTSRVGYLPTITHGAITPPRQNSVSVPSGKINPDDFEDID